MVRLVEHAEIATQKLNSAALLIILEIEDEVLIWSKQANDYRTKGAQKKQKSTSTVPNVKEEPYATNRIPKILRNGEKTIMVNNRISLIVLVQKYN